MDIFNFSKKFNVHEWNEKHIHLNIYGLSKMKEKLNFEEEFIRIRMKSDGTVRFDRFIIPGNMMIMPFHADYFVRVIFYNT